MIDAVQSFIKKIVLTPDGGKNRLVSDFHGSLVGILTLSVESKFEPQPTNAVLEVHNDALGLVQNEKSDPQ